MLGQEWKKGFEEGSTRVKALFVASLFPHAAVLGFWIAAHATVCKNSNEGYACMMALT